MTRVSQPYIAPLAAQDQSKGESLADMQGMILLETIRHTLTIHAEMFRRILDSTSRPSFMLAELLEEAGNRYIDFSQLVSAATLRTPLD